MLETADVLELDTTLDVAGAAELLGELEAEEVWTFDDTVDIALEDKDVLALTDELGTEEVEETTDEKPELDFVLETELETDLMTLDWMLDDWVLNDWVLIWLLEVEVFELVGMLEALLEVEELTDDCTLDDKVLEGLLTEPDGAVEWVLEELLETVALLLLELLGEAVE